MSCAVIPSKSFHCASWHVQYTTSRWCEQEGRTGLGAESLSTAKRMDMSVEVPMQHMSELSKPNTWSERLQNKVRSAVVCCRKKNSCSSYGPKSPTHNRCYSVAPSFRSLLLRVWRLNCSSASCRELRVSCSCGLTPCASTPSCSEHIPVQKRFKKKVTGGDARRDHCNL